MRWYVNVVPADAEAFALGAGVDIGGSASVTSAVELECEFALELPVDEFVLDAGSCACAWPCAPPEPEGASEMEALG